MKNQRKVGRPPKGELTENEKAECSFLKQIREANKMTQQDICEEVLSRSDRYNADKQPNPNVYRQYESGKQRIPSWMKDCFSKYFDIPRDQFDDPTGSIDQEIQKQRMQSERIADYTSTPDDHYLFNLLRYYYRFIGIDEEYNLIFRNRGKLLKISGQEFTDLSKNVRLQIDEVINKATILPAVSGSAERSDEKEAAPAKTRKKKSKLSDNSKKGV